jgi:ribonuclease HI
MTKIEIYSDGSAQPNPGKGGYGIVLKYKEHRKEISQGFLKTTNNRMELLGAIVGIENINGVNKDIELTTDSKYVTDAINKGWIYQWEKKNFIGRKNSDLWKRLLTLLPKHNIMFIWVKGHNNHVENERCDTLAVNATNSNNLIIDNGYN